MTKTSQSPQSQSSEMEEHVEVDLRQPGVAAFWAWAWPGAGHLYQGRYAKGMLFMICILGTYFFGLALGGGNVVYASFTDPEGRGGVRGAMRGLMQRWHYGAQVCVGVPALPAFIQWMRVDRDREPLLGGFMAPPREFPPGTDRRRPEATSELAEWQESKYFELGTLYTVVAGLLNILVIYDAYAGPIVPGAADTGKKKEKNKSPPKK